MYDYERLPPSQNFTTPGWRLFDTKNSEKTLATTTDPVFAEKIKTALNNKKKE